MYEFPYFKENDERVIREFVDQHPFAFITGCDAGNKPVVTQIPVFIEEQDKKLYMRGHMMKNTDHHKAFLHNSNVLVVFSGSHTYVSATWYTNPNEASTWNYMSVHARGIMRFLDDDALISVLRKTSLHFEGQNRQSPTVLDNLPTEYVQKLMKSIVAFEVEVTELKNVFKLSQNRNRKSYETIIEKLSEQDENAKVIAGEMEKRKEDLFREKGKER